MEPSERTTLEFVFPRMYQALPKTGSADVTLPADASPVTRPFIADLVILYGFDMGELFQVVAQRDLARLGVTEDELHARALQNLRALNLQIQAQQGEHCAMLTAGGNFEATLVLLPEVWEAIQPMVTGSIVAVVPARDVLFFTGDAVPENLAEMRRWTSQMLEQADKPLSRSFLRWEGGTWVEHEGFAD